MIILILQSPNVAHTIVKRHTRRTLGRRVEHVRRQQPLDIPNILDSIHPLLIYLDQPLRIRLDSVVPERDPEHLRGRVKLARELCGRGHVVPLQDLGDVSEGGEARGRRLGAFLRAEEVGGRLAGGDVVADVDNCAGGDGRVVTYVVGEAAGGVDEGFDGLGAEELDGGADLGDGKSAEDETGYEAEVVGAAFEGPEEIWMGGGVCGDESAVAEDDVVGDDIVHGETVLVDEVVDAADEGQTGDTDSLEAAADDVLAVGCQVTIGVKPGVAGADSDGVGGVRDLELIHTVERDQDAIFDVV